MTAPDVLERCRMALAEIGLSPDLARLLDGRTVVSRSIGVEQVWMLHCTTAVPKPCLCWPCYAAMDDAIVSAPTADRRAISADALRACGAWRPFQRESCGATT